MSRGSVAVQIIALVVFVVYRARASSAHLPQSQAYVVEGTGV